jgi:hypothetical protein
MRRCWRPACNPDVSMRTRHALLAWSPPSPLGTTYPSNSRRFDGSPCRHVRHYPVPLQGRSAVAAGQSNFYRPVHHRELARRVGTEAHAAVEACHRRGVDNMIAFAVRTRMRQEAADSVQDTYQVNVEHLSQIPKGRYCQCRCYHRHRHCCTLRVRVRRTRTSPEWHARH